MRASMSVAAVVVVVAGGLAVLATLAWIVFHRNDPEHAAGHADHATTGSALMFGDVNDRPGDPGTESMAVPRPGEPGPSPHGDRPVR
jgi:hypothetical protein